MPILEEARSVLEGAGIAYGVTITTHALGAAALRLGDDEQALTLTAEALPGFIDHDDPDGVAHCLFNISAALARLSLPREAALLDAAGERIRAELGIVVAPESRSDMALTRSQLKQALGPEFATVQAEGRQLSDAEAIELALQATDRALGQPQREP